MRPSMESLVGRIRSVTGASENDVFHGMTYWSDDQLEAELDKVRYAAWSAPLVPVPRKVDGSTIYTVQNFAIPRGYWLEDTFTVRDSEGNEVTTPYSVTYNQQQGTVAFDSNPGSDQLYIDLFLYDWNAAAASIWEQKAAHRFDFINVKAGDHKFDAEKEYLHCVERARWHASRKVKTFSRTPSRFVPYSYHNRTRR